MKQSADSRQVFVKKGHCRRVSLPPLSKPTCTRFAPRVSRASVLSFRDKRKKKKKNVGQKFVAESFSSAFIDRGIIYKLAEIQARSGRGRGERRGRLRHAFAWKVSRGLDSFNMYSTLRFQTTDENGQVAFANFKRSPSMRNGGRLLLPPKMTFLSSAWQLLRNESRKTASSAHGRSEKFE